MARILLLPWNYRWRRKKERQPFQLSFRQTVPIIEISPPNGVSSQKRNHEMSSSIHSHVWKGAIMLVWMKNNLFLTPYFIIIVFFSLKNVTKPVIWKCIMTPGMKLVDTSYYVHYSLLPQKSHAWSNLHTSMMWLMCHITLTLPTTKALYRAVHPWVSYLIAGSRPFRN